MIDVGANRGQYASRLRAAGWTGPILSIEPIPELQPDLLAARAAADPDWEIAPPVAVGAVAGEIALEVSAESDMSSTLAQSALLRDISPTSAVLRRIVVPQYRLDWPELLGARPWRRLFVKIDVQGAEPAVLAGHGWRSGRVSRGCSSSSPCCRSTTASGPGCELLGDLAAARASHPICCFPGYFSRALGRQVQVDMVFYRA